MTIVSAFMIPGSPLPYVQSDNPPWGRLADAMKKASKSLAASKPDTIIVYSTSWFAVLDQLWQTKPHLKGVHVDENWHEYGDLPFDIHIDTELAEQSILNANNAGIKSKGVNYDQFPIDTGTIVASNFLNPGNKLPLMLASNNLYHDWKRTEALGQISAKAADQLGRRVAIVVIGKLSGAFFRQNINISEDEIASRQDDQWNKKMLDLLSQGQMEEFFETCPQYAQEAKVDMGFKHMAFLKGALGEKLSGGKVLAYEPLYGSGGAVIEFSV
jgi:2-aminophenol/2-amino-5-chlorophenol 1,6-dioxygenase alpha subunit